MGDSWWDIKGDHPLTPPPEFVCYCTEGEMSASSGAWRLQHHAESGSLLPGVSPEAWRAQSGEGAPVPLGTRLYLQLTQGSPSSSRNKKQCPPNPSSSPPPPTEEKKQEADAIPPSSCTGLAPAKKEESRQPGAPQSRTLRCPSCPEGHEEGQSSHSPTRGTSKRQRATPGSRQVFIFPRHIPTD